jgi:hypothetical protein
VHDAARDGHALLRTEHEHAGKARSEFLALAQKAEEAGDHGRGGDHRDQPRRRCRAGGPIPTALDHAEAAVVLFREVGDDGGVGVSLETCGWNDLALSDPARAQQAFRNALVIFNRLGSIRHTAISSLGLGAAL